MANKEISELTSKATLATTDEFEIQETGGGTSKKATLAAILTNPSITGDITMVSGNGISFSATADGTTMSSELFDDYEEGTATLQIADDSLDGSGEGQTYGTQTLRYVKIGRLVHFFGELSVSSLGTLTTSQAVRILGLPFTSSSANDPIGSVFVGSATSMSMTATASISGVIPTATAYMILNLWDATTGQSNMLLSEFSTGLISLSGTYEV